jgi:hypothetical protein
MLLGGAKREAPAQAELRPPIYHTSFKTKSS